MSTNPQMFDFGGGVNFNPMAAVSPNVNDPFGNSGGGSSGLQLPANGGAMPSGGAAPTMFNASNPTTGGYTPSWSPNTNTGVGSQPVNSFTTSSNSTGQNGLLPFYQGAYNHNPSTDLTNAFGNLGPYLLNMIQTGGYNPQVFQALVNQLQPQVNEGIATIGAQTGANGTRFGSGYSLALGDYLSQVNLNESSMAAGLYEDSVKNSLAGLGIAAGPQAQNKSNQGGFLSSLLSSIIGPATSAAGDIFGF